MSFSLISIALEFLWVQTMPSSLISNEAQTLPVISLGQSIVPRIRRRRQRGRLHLYPEAFEWERRQHNADTSMYLPTTSRETCTQHAHRTCTGNRGKYP